MGQFVKGQVVILPFPFFDLSATKRRPALVVASLSGSDVILCQITSVMRSDAYTVQIDEDDFVTGSLDRISFVRTNRIFTADTAIITKVAGQLSQRKIKAVIDRLIKILSQ